MDIEPWFSREKMNSLLHTKIFGRNLVLLDTVDSTNLYAQRNAEALADGTAVIARGQTAGCGRRGRKWETDARNSLALSVLLKSPHPERYTAIGLACGLAAARSLNALCAGGFEIKWPNDIVCAGKKVCGILCQSRIARPGGEIVCGIGVNLFAGQEYFDSLGLANASSVKILKGKSPSLEETAAALLNEFETVFSAYAKGGAQVFLTEYSSLSATLEKPVRALTPEGEIKGVAKAVLPDGALEILAGAKTVTVRAGDVSVRGLSGYL